MAAPYCKERQLEFKGCLAPLHTFIDTCKQLHVALFCEIGMLCRVSRCTSTMIRKHTKLDDLMIKIVNLSNRIEFTEASVHYKKNGCHGRFVCVKGKSFVPTYKHQEQVVNPIVDVTEWLGFDPNRIDLDGMRTQVQRHKAQAIIKAMKIMQKVAHFVTYIVDVCSKPRYFVRLEFLGDEPERDEQGNNLYSNLHVALQKLIEGISHMFFKLVRHNQQLTRQAAVRAHATREAAVRAYAFK